jgi:hypothetical protein
MKTLHGLKVPMGNLSAINQHHNIDYKPITASFGLATRLLSFRVGLQVLLNWPSQLAPKAGLI